MSTPRHPEPNHGIAEEKELRIMHAELADQSNRIPTLDLHGLTKENALDNVRQFLSHQIFTGESCCRIVHGKGKGVLERVIKREIAGLVNDQKIESSFPSRRSPGAAIIVVFPFHH
jgi:DNA-nicking Smr family endonuclease